MAISFPLALPAGRAVKRIVFRARSTVGVSASPFSAEQQLYVHQGEVWSAEVSLIPMRRADAEEWVAFQLALNGMEGTFLLGDLLNISPRGTWSGGSPLVAGASQSGKVLNVDGLTAGATGKKGDWFQLGSGSGSRLHKLTLDFTANGAGEAGLDFWPRLRSSPSDDAPLTLASPKGVFRLASNEREWSIELAQLYGLSFACIEAL